MGKLQQVLSKQRGGIGSDDILIMVNKKTAAVVRFIFIFYHMWSYFCAIYCKSFTSIDKHYSSADVLILSIIMSLRKSPNKSMF